MKQIISLHALILPAIGLVGCTGQPKLPEKPNILFITTDYTRAADLPAAGASFVQMPAVDRLSQEGVVFMRHSSTASICMPARATWVTGTYPHKHNLWDNRQISVKKEGEPFLISDLKDLGYTTVGIGKMHFSPTYADYGYDYRIIQEGKSQSTPRNDDYEDYLRERGFDRTMIYNLEGKWDVPRGQSFNDWPLDESLHYDAFVGIKTLETIQKGIVNKENPWFMWVSFTGPHNPWDAPGRLASIYRDMDDLPTGEYVEGELNTKPIEYTRHRYGYGGSLLNIYDTLSPDKQALMRRDLRAGHYGLLSFIDEWVEDIMEQLEQSGLLENTIVIFTSDHGSALFDNEMLHKGSPFPTQLMVPFVVWCPKYFKSGKRNGFSSHVDVYATLMELAGKEQVAKTQGTSLVPMLVNPKANTQDFVVHETCLVTSLMNDDWLVGFHPISKETELYDLHNDPMCHYNIADDPKHKEIIESLKQTLIDWRRSVSDGEIGYDPLYWDKELGEPEHVAAFRRGYIKSYRWLQNIDDARPGKTGSVAARYVERISKNEN